MDGPAGAGKSTVARIVANRLGYLYIDTGAMYRALALKALRLGIPETDAAALADLAGSTEVELQRAPDGGNRVLLDGEDVTAEIRTPAVSAVVSQVSAVPEAPAAADRGPAGHGPGRGCGDGRPGHRLVRPARRGSEVLYHCLPAGAGPAAAGAAAGEGHVAELAAVEAEIARRDEQDMNKGVHSLVRLPESIVIDTTGKRVDEVVEEILRHCRRK